MKKGLALTLSVLAIALMPALSFGYAPMFSDVPGVINIGNLEASPAGYVYTAVFPFDASVVDQDSDDSIIGWSYDEYTVGLTYTGSVFTVTGKTPVTSNDQRTSPAMYGKVLNNAYNATHFSITDTEASIFGGAGQATGVKAYYVAKAPYLDPIITGAVTATTITVNASDGFNVTRKAVLVTTNNNTYDWTSGVATQLDAWTTGTDHTGWSSRIYYPGPEYALRLAFDFEDTSGVRLTPNTDFGDSPAAPMIVVGSAESPMHTFTVDKGKMYRMTTRVWAPDAGSNVDAQQFRLRLGITSGTFDALATLNIISLDSTQSKTSPWNDGNGGYDGVVYEHIFSPPQATRLEGFTYSTVSTQLFYDIVDTGSYMGDPNEGALVFGDTTLDELDIPELGANGMAAKWQYVEEFDSPTNPILPVFDEGHTFTNPQGWSYYCRQILLLEPPFATAEHVDHGGLILDGATTASFNGGADDEDTLELFAGAGNIMSQWIYGEPDGDTNHNESAINYDWMWDATQGNVDNVWYRMTVVMRSSNESVINDPAFRVRLGQPFGINTSWLDINAGNYGYFMPNARIKGSEAGPISTEDTVYQVWIKGLAKAQEDTLYPDINNLAINIDLLDFAGAGTMGTLVIDDVFVEQFPADWF